MAQTLYAAFADAAHAESAAGALLDHGIAADRISLVVSEKAKKGVEREISNPGVVTDANATSREFDPMDQGTRGPIPTVGAGAIPNAEPEDVVDDLNPAQNDYPRRGSDSPTELSSRPPNSKYDWNPDLDKKSYNADYERTNSEKMDDEIRMEGERDRARVDPASNVKENDEGLAGDQGIAASPDVFDGNVIKGQDSAYDAERAAKAGVSTTTITDAAKGAAKGVGFGLGVGALAAVASIAVPGVGLVLGGGALAAAVAALAATTGAGAVAGGVVGYLKDQGVPADQIPVYQKAYEGGGALLSVVLEDETTANVEAILAKYGATDVRPVKSEA